MKDFIGALYFQIVGETCLKKSVQKVCWSQKSYADGPQVCGKVLSVFLLGNVSCQEMQGPLLGSQVKWQSSEFN